MNEIEKLLGAINIGLPVRIEELQEYLAETRLGQSMIANIVIGKPLSFQLRDDQHVYYFSKEDVERDLSSIDSLAELYGHSPPSKKAIFPGMTQFDAALLAVQQELQELRDFTTKCVGGRLDLAFINKCFTNAMKNGVIGFIENGWTPILQIFQEFPNIVKSFQDDIEQQLILAPLAQGKAVEWSKIKTCEQCGRFFFPQRASGRFCGTPCRMKSNQRKGAST